MNVHMYVYIETYTSIACMHNDKFTPFSCPYNLKLNVGVNVSCVDLWYVHNAWGLFVGSRHACVAK